MLGGFQVVEHLPGVGDPCRRAGAQIKGQLAIAAVAPKIPPLEQPTQLLTLLVRQHINLLLPLDPQNIPQDAGHAVLFHILQPFQQRFSANRRIDSLQMGLDKLIMLNERAVINSEFFKGHTVPPSL